MNNINSNKENESLNYKEKKNSDFIKSILEKDLNLLNNKSIESKINTYKNNKINYDDIEINDENKEVKKIEKISHEDVKRKIEEEIGKRKINEI